MSPISVPITRLPLIPYTVVLTKQSIQLKITLPNTTSAAIARCVVCASAGEAVEAIDEVPTETHRAVISRFSALNVFERLGACELALSIRLWLS